LTLAPAPKSPPPALRRPHPAVPAEPEEPRRREFRFERHHFDFIAGLVHRLAGIALPPHKVEMMYSRLARRLRELGMADFDEYCALLEADGDGRELGALINALTTNLTSFFRERHHFDHLAATTLPEARAAGSGGKTRLRIWSAGCSSGEEPYTIALVIMTAVPDLTRWDARILATDIDTRMLETARRGVYPAEAVEGVPVAVRDRFFRKTGRSDPGAPPLVTVGDELRRLITFKSLNLMEPWPMGGPFDAIFCRNVLIYFDRAGRSGVVDRFADLLRPRGYLYLGHSENLHGVSRRFALAGSTLYRRVS